MQVALAAAVCAAIALVPLSLLAQSDVVILNDRYKLLGDYDSIVGMVENQGNLMAQECCIR
jgi:hypothetical protein